MGTGRRVLRFRPTGREKKFNEFLELHHAGGVDVVWKKDTGRRFQQLVEVVRQRLPDKRVPSMMETRGIPAPPRVR